MHITKMSWEYVLYIRYLTIEIVDISLNRFLSCGDIRYILLNKQQFFVVFCDWASLLVMSFNDY